MSVASPWMLLLALIPVAGLLRPLLPSRTPGAPPVLPAVLRAFAAGGRVRIGAALPRLPWRFWCGCLLLILVLARPQWGARPEDSRHPGELILALDLSRSMLATDALPSRLERARTIATRLIAQSPAAPVGLIAFAGRAYLLATPSADRALLTTFLPALQPEQMVVPGSNFAGLLDAALRAFSPRSRSSTLILLSDGEADPTPWRALLPPLRARGIHVIAVGLGTAEGTQIRIHGRALTGPGGTPVTSRLRPDVLREIAAATGGAYLDAAQSTQLAARIQDIRQTPLPTGPSGGLREDRFAWFLGPALIMLLWSALTEWPAVPRLARTTRRWAKPATGAALALLATLLASPRSQADRPPPLKPPQHQAAPDPLADVKDVVSRMLAHPPASAADYRALAQAAVRYGEAHRHEPHLLQAGVLRDGLAAIDAGEALDPRNPGWAEARADLTRLLKPPRHTDDPEEGDGDPDGPQPDPQGPPPEEAGYNPQGAPQDTRDVGGTQRNSAGQTDWRVPSLVKPLYALQRLRGTDQPGEIFHLLQLQEPAPTRPDGQTW